MIRRSIPLLAVALCICGAFAHEDYEDVTCGSVIKLENVESSFLLHSHDISWGSGSRQQSVTAFEAHDDPNSLWLVKEAHQDPMCSRGSPIPCGTIVRLEHVSTGHNLHSHDFPSPMSRLQEVSAYGSDGSGDTGDDWELQCDTAVWKRQRPVQLRHVETGRYLSTHSGRDFNDRNCHNCPIVGQLEVAASPSRGSSEEWVADLGIYF
mmetsp:Transcript_21292/g.68700  ORF Transcript_21292/g.68700 Transcript_21292/m.68700 type:complete len:208 (-) Transcript_21292:76-699(-)